MPRKIGDVDTQGLGSFCFPFYFILNRLDVIDVQGKVKSLGKRTALRQMNTLGEGRL